jgi:uncharacterized phage-associated protein
MPEIEFEFSLSKLVHAVAMLSQLGVTDLTKLKVVKLLYFADKAHLLEFGAPILGDVYYCMDYGPVPSFALNQLNEALFRREVVGESPNLKMINEVLRVRKPWTRYPHFEAKNGYDASVFSVGELNILAKTAAELGRFSALELVERTHSEPTWCIPNSARRTGSSTRIPYELFFEGCDDLGRKHLAQLVCRFRGEVIELAGDAGYQEFARALLEEDSDVDWSLDKDQRRAPVAH